MIRLCTYFRSSGLVVGSQLVQLLLNQYQHRQKSLKWMPQRKSSWRITRSPTIYLNRYICVLCFYFGKYSKSYFWLSSCCCGLICVMKLTTGWPKVSTQWRQDCSLFKHCCLPPWGRSACLKSLKKNIKWNKRKN